MSEFWRHEIEEAMKMSKRAKGVKNDEHVNVQKERCIKRVNTFQFAMAQAAHLCDDQSHGERHLGDDVQQVQPDPMQRILPD